jgi:hypothetical protein
VFHQTRFLRRCCLAVIVGGLAASAVLVGCGGKTESSFDEGVEPQGGDGSGGSATAGSAQGAGPGSGGFATGGSGTAGSTAIGGMPSGGMPPQVGGATGSAGFPALDGGVGECLTCVATMCPEAQDCFNDPVCLQGSICAATTCLSGQDASAGGLDCWLGCFGNDPGAAVTAFTAFSCVASSCGMGCAGAFEQ